MPSIHYRIDDGSGRRLNESRRGSMGVPVTVYRTNFVCKHCGHHKCFSKSGMKECCRCKKIN